ncbi:hypothetical protein LROSRS0_0785 [Furfurilactobacillus rossiae]|uniref:Uncharacterized protein n=1 Tax=Furfurilactobacillus rossiae DSM 15814 TaxID=1114972 RepID=A0A0R1RQX1_9LACO|nr:hypothetical protein FD35_GL001977 [Furfurilactobacillus rossiae DSM 15814]QLE60832.1 hypothetical protein LROSRS0_0785 [Furfurilactobacillus rossiae]
MAVDIKHEHAVTVFEEWLMIKRKDRRHFRLIRHLAYLDWIMTGEGASPAVEDLAAAQAVSQLDNSEFLQCLMKLPYRRQVLTGDGEDVLAWFDHVEKTAHSHLFSNIGLLMEIVLDEEAGHSVQQWDSTTIATAHQLAELSNDQLLTVISQLASAKKQPRLSESQRAIGHQHDHRLHLHGQIEPVNDPRQI